MLTVGIDEAGYGPLLGPLVVAGVSIRTEDTVTERELARRLQSALAEAGAASGRRLVADDSKQVLSNTRGHDTLRDTIAAVAQACGGDGTVGGLCDIRHTEAPAPWHVVPTTVLVREPDPTGLRDALQRHGIRGIDATAALIQECAFNAAVGGDRNKGDLLFDAHADVYERLRQGRIEAEPVRAVFDRHGGRQNYLPPIGRRWPQAFAWEVTRRRERSDYRVGPDTLSFRVRADADAPWVGLASMLAKYLRELAMDTFNEHFRSLCPQVRPTAGYVQDGRRWLDETRAARATASVPDERLVRTR